MSLLVRLRIELADTPGALAEVAAIIAEHGGNISAIDVQQGAAAAVDEITVEFAQTADLAALRRRLEESGAVTVLSLQTADPADLVVRVMQSMARLVVAGPGNTDAELRRGVAELCGTPAVWVATSEEAFDFEVGRMALGCRGEAVLGRSDEPLPAWAGTMHGEVFLLGIAERSASDAGRVVLVGRPVTQRFTATELRRVEEFMAVYEQVDALRRAALTSL